MSSIHAVLARFLEEGERVAVATVVRGRGSTPRAAGAKMLVMDGGRTRFTVGGGAFEAAVVRDCLAALADGAGPRICKYDLAEHGENAVGMTCGGSVEVFIEVESPARRLVIFGAGHVGRALAAAARLAGFAVTVVDDRAEWLDASAFPPGTALHRCRRDYGSDLPALREDDCVAVVTRCHATDIAALEAVSGASPAYVGMIGSQRKVAKAFRDLESRGVSRAWLSTVHAPIGLDVGAETPGEIGVAIAAELVAAVRGAAPVRITAESARRAAVLPGAPE